jgi:hypothetical protein
MSTNYFELLKLFLSLNKLSKGMFPWTLKYIAMLCLDKITGT